MAIAAIRATRARLRRHDMFRTYLESPPVGGQPGYARPRAAIDACSLFGLTDGTLPSHHSNAGSGPRGGADAASGRSPGREPARRLPPDGGSDGGSGFVH